MYQPAAHREDTLARQHDLIRAHPLAVLIVAGASGLSANHIPFVLDAGRGAKGTLKGHVARANPVWREGSGAPSALVVFRGHEAYVSPAWYPSKAETGKVVPTWNYVAVHAQGPFRAIEDPHWLRQQIGELTAQMEGGRPQPWSVNDAPADYIEAMARGIVGIEIAIERLDGKWKVSQNKSNDERRGVIAGLRAEGGEAAGRMADLVELEQAGKSFARRE